MLHSYVSLSERQQIRGPMRLHLARRSVSTDLQSRRTYANRGYLDTFCGFSIVIFIVPAGSRECPPLKSASEIGATARFRRTLHADTGTSAGFWLGGQCPLQFPPEAKKIFENLTTK